MKRWLHRINAIWLALLAATAITAWLGEHAGAQGLGTGAAILVLAATLWPR